jgi:hypothetical protein
MSLALLSVLSVPATNLMALRGGMALGPLDSDLAGEVLKVAAAITVTGGLAEKYAGLGDTALSSFVKSDGVFATNALIALITYATNGLVTMGDSGLDTAKLTAGLWLASSLLNLKSNNFDIATLWGSQLGESIVALALAVLTFA